MVNGASAPPSTTQYIDHTTAEGKGNLLLIISCSGPSVPYRHNKKKEELNKIQRW